MIIRVFVCCSTDDCSDSNTTLPNGYSQQIVRDIWYPVDSILAQVLEALCRINPVSPSKSISSKQFFMKTSFLRSALCKMAVDSPLQSASWLHEVRDVHVNLSDNVASFNSG